MTPSDTHADRDAAAEDILDTDTLIIRLTDKSTGKAASATDENDLASQLGHDGPGWMPGAEHSTPTLHRLAEVVNAERGSIVFVSDHEAVVEYLTEKGVLATGDTRGYGKWDPSLSRHFVGLRVLLLVDDGPRALWSAIDIFSSLYKEELSIHVLCVRQGTIYDWLRNGGEVGVMLAAADEPEGWGFLPDAPREGSPSQTNPSPSLRFRTAREIAASTPESPDWVVAPWVAVGSITELTGVPKIGKSELVFAMVRAVLDGVDFLGYPTTATPVVCLIEQPDASLRQAMGRAGLLDHDDLYILSWADSHEAPWPAVAEAAVEYARAVGAGLLVVDTLPQFASLLGDAENTSGAALQAVQPLQLAADTGLGVLAVRHERKGGGDPGEASRGSNAFTGVVDTIISVRRSEGNVAPTIRRLQTISRFSDPPPELIIERTNAGFISHGEGGALAKLAARARLLDLLPTEKDAAMTEKEVFEGASDLRRTTARDALAELLQEGAVTRSGEGRRGQPYRYWRPNAGSGFDSDELPPLGREFVRIETDITS